MLDLKIINKVNEVRNRPVNHYLDYYQKYLLEMY